MNEGEAILAEAVSAYQAALGPRLLAVYALGSLAHGGFSPLVSDVDLGLVLTDPPTSDDPETLRLVAESVKAGGSALHERLSVFWGTPRTLQGAADGGRFPPLDRLDLLENGRLLTGDDVRSGLPAPTPDELLVAGAEFALDFLGPGMPVSPAASVLGSLVPSGEAVMDEVRHPERLALPRRSGGEPGHLPEEGPRHVTKIVLFPVRFLFTAATGRLGTNDAAAAHHLARSDAPGRELVAAALRWRTAPPDDHRTATGLLQRELVPLYVYYLDDHIPRLTALGRSDLARAFGRWKDRLLA